MHYVLQKKSFKKKKVKTNASISQTSSEHVKVTIQNYQMKNKELKLKLGNFKTKNMNLHEVALEEQQKHLQCSQNNATCHAMNTETNLYSSDKRFIYFISNVLH